MAYFLTILFGAIYTITILTIVTIIIADNRNPLKTLPWIMVVVLLPFVGVLIYLVFGVKLRNREIIRRRNRRRLSPYQKIVVDNDLSIDARWDGLASLISQTSGASMTFGSDITVFSSGQKKFGALLEAVNGAKSHIHIQYYIIDDDRSGNTLREALEKKAREGVVVRLLYDDVGCRHTSKAFFRSLKSAGVQAHPFMHVLFPKMASKMNYRNHRKVVVIDGQIGFVGGMNIADRYMGATDQQTWRDNHFRVVGPMVKALQAAFLSDWSVTTRQKIRGERYYPELEMCGGSTAQILLNTPFEAWPIFPQVLSYAIANARKRIYIQTPYFIPTDVVETALQAAALSGVDVRLMIPLKSDSMVVDLATQSYLENMLKAGVKILLYKKGMLHAKSIIIDDYISVIGSVNMDFRSFEHNFEISSFVYDREFNERLCALFRRDSIRSRTLALRVWKKRGAGRRFAESFMRMFSPLL